MLSFLYVYSDHSILECYNLFSGVELSMRSFFVINWKGTHFSWTKEHENAYRKLKEALTNSPVMRYFDIQRDTIVLVDASPMGISAILAQKEKGTNENRIIGYTYASRALTPVENGTHRRSAMLCL